MIGSNPSPCKHNVNNKVSCISTHAKPSRALTELSYFEILTKSAIIISRMEARLECERRPLEYGRVRKLEAVAWQCSVLKASGHGWLAVRSAVRNLVADRRLGLKTKSKVGGCERGAVLSVCPLLTLVLSSRTPSAVAASHSPSQGGKFESPSEDSGRKKCDHII